MGKDKKYKVTYQLECTLVAKNDQEAREIALAYASGQGLPGFQRFVSELKSRPPQPPECTGEWTVELFAGVQIVTEGFVVEATHAPAVLHFIR